MGDEPMGEMSDEPIGDDDMSDEPMVEMSDEPIGDDGMGDEPMGDMGDDDMGDESMVDMGDEPVGDDDMGDEDDDELTSLLASIFNNEDDYMVSDDLVPSLGLLDISGATIECMRAGIVEVVGLERETEVINALVWYSSLEEYSLLLETSADHPLSVDEHNEVATILAICIAPEVLEQFTGLEGIYTEAEIDMLECVIQDPGIVDNFIVPSIQATLF